MAHKIKIIENIFSHKNIRKNGDIVNINIERVEKNSQYPEGIRYSLSYISNGESLLRYDNYAGHSHHKHIKNKRILYDFKDEWMLIEDFDKDLELLGIKL